MERTEIEEELKMSYEELQHYLNRKYGASQFDYFPTAECKSRNTRVSRTKEGLFCHHIDEDKGVDLCKPTNAKRQSYDWQKKERLVYCNAIEHLILHIKIAVLRQKGAIAPPFGLRDFFTSGGIYMVCSDINDMFMNDGTSVAWKKRCYSEISENYEDYILLLKALSSYIEMNYAGNTSEPAFLVPGSKVHFSDYDCEILSVTKNKGGILLRLPSGEEKKLKSIIAVMQYTYADQIDFVLRDLASGHEVFYASIYDDAKSDKDKDLAYTLAKLLKVDFHGHGFPEYAHILLGKEYGAENADEYISKALPMYCKNAIDISHKTPVFWKGAELPLIANNSFFIVRIKASFSVKKGMDPFVRYREADFLRSEFNFDFDDNRNIKEIGWTVLATSDVFDSKTKKYYSKYRDFNGDLVDARVILTLGKDDYLLFRERYDISYLELLDGCYFE